MDDIHRKKLIFRSKNRGCKEMDIILTRFSDNELNKLSESELHLYEEFLNEDDGYMYKWITGELEMPEQYKRAFGSKLA